MQISFKSNTMYAVILAILAALLLSISFSLLKQVNPNISSILVVFIRSCFASVLFIPTLVLNRKVITKTKKLFLYIIRVILTVCAMSCTYYTYRNLPISIATTIGMTSPLFVNILSIIVLKDQIKFDKWLLIVLGYIGILIIIRPIPFVLDYCSILAIISGLLANLLAGVIIIIIKILTRYDDPTIIVLYTNLGMIIVSFLLSIQKWQVLNLKDIILIFFIGITGITAQFFSTKALKYSNPAFIAPFEYTRILFAILIEWITD